MGREGHQTEADVRAFTRILTGWSYVRPEEADEGIDGGTQQNRGQYIYRAYWHEPDPIAMMGKIYPASGEQQAELVLKDIARHPATAAQLAFKLVQHFVADEPTARDDRSHQECFPEFRRQPEDRRARPDQPSRGVVTAAHQDPNAL